LYEMLSGERAFEGPSAASVIAAILEREPAPLDTAPPLERIVRTCVAKDPEHRFQTAIDLKRNLTWALEQPIAAKTNRRAWMAVAVAALAKEHLVDGQSHTSAKLPRTGNRCGSRLSRRRMGGLFWVGALLETWQFLPMARWWRILLRLIGR